VNAFFRWLFGVQQPKSSKLGYQAPAAPLSKPQHFDGGMNEGDFHSGPHGYSPNTAYPETQYGSNFDEEAEWNEDH
jgi:hypothetical protein